MYLAIRNKLPLAVAGFWLWLSWRAAGQPGFNHMFRMMLDRTLVDRWTEFEIFTWFAAMIATMLGVDRLWVEFTRYRIGVDPRTVHWSRLRNRDGAFICAECQSPFLLPPADLDEDKMVCCGDCGAPKARYGEMKPLLDPKGAVKWLAWRVLR